MNKIEYLNALKEALKNTDDSVMEEIVSDYEEHFQVGLENGKSEEQICDELGAIDDLVQEIKEVYHTDNNENKEAEDNQKNANNKKSKEWHFNIPNIDSEKIGGVINSALDSAGEAISKIDVIEIGHTLKNTLGQATASINNFTDNYIKNKGMGPFDFNKWTAEGYKENVTKSYDPSEEPEETGKSSVSYDAEPDDVESESRVPGDADNGDVVGNTEAGNTEAGNTEAGNTEAGNTEARNTEAGNTEVDNTEAENIEAESTESESTVPGNAEPSDIMTGDTDSNTEASDCTQADIQDSSDETDTVSREENGEKSISVDDKSEPEPSINTKSGLNLMIDGFCADVMVQKSSNDKININYENNGDERQKLMYEFYSYKEGNTIYAGIRKVGKSVFLFNLKPYSIHINVELPESMGNVNIKTASGDIRITNVSSDRIIAETASGNIFTKQIYTTDFRIKSASGDIKLEDVNSIKLVASTLSGDVGADKLETKFLSLKSASGDVDASNLITDIIENSSLSGDLDIANMKARECKLRSTSGDIVVKDLVMNNADISNVSGDIKLTGIVGDGLRACSTSGNVIVQVTLKRCHASSKSGKVEVSCDGDILLESSSTSGNVTIILKNNGNGYLIKSRTTSGELSINYNNTLQKKLKTGTYTSGNQGSELILSSVSGDIYIND